MSTIKVKVLREHKNDWGKDRLKKVDSHYDIPEEETPPLIREGLIEDPKPKAKG